MEQETRKKLNLLFAASVSLTLDLVSKYLAWTLLVVPLTGLKTLSFFQVFVIGHFFYLFTVTGKQAPKESVDERIDVHTRRIGTYVFYIIVTYVLSYFVI